MRLVENVEDIYWIHFDLINRCNGHCAFCIRRRIPEASNTRKLLTFEDIRGIVSQTSNLKRALFCGSRGDAIFHPEIKEITQFLEERNIKCKIHTNGSIRSEKWWKDFAKTKSKVIFGIDGIQNDLYRKIPTKTRFRNMIAFKEAGGDAEWQWIPFQYNFKEIPEAIKISKNLQIPFFTKTSRQYESDSFLSIPQGIKSQQDLRYEKKINECEIKCTFKNSIFISCDGIIYPCIRLHISQNLCNNIKIPLTDILHSFEFENLRNKIRTIEIEKCKDCVVKPDDFIKYVESNLV